MLETLANRQRRPLPPGSASGTRVRVQHPGQQPERPATDPQIDVGVAKTDITGLIQGSLVVAGQPRQAVPKPSPDRAVSGAPTAPPCRPPAAHFLYRASRSAMTHQPDRRAAGGGLR